MRHRLYQAKGALANPSRVECLSRESRGRKDPGLFVENRSAVQDNAYQHIVSASRADARRMNLRENPMQVILVLPVRVVLLEL